ncbi:BON domain-containing protein [Shewanella frigidimarina]|uniref:Transport-associated n=1 Tax=Shewanella frigidimarina (strain NCIMB 400) TaxID=318167 RepID=Q07VZ4_SHEFN|nr:BON domain-containing protein [Shewanella frigidimarina]ABI73820.1 transport-associated [Shewanella frigidimarina NCIMB 400]RPA35900.1 BON domain-containing protein [Shewanella frigidimarina]
MKKTTLSVVMSIVLGSMAFGANAAQDWQDDAKDAWIDGKAETTLLLNTNLNSFDINTDVHDGNVTLTGKVNSSVDKSLAGELIRSLDGVKDVNNELSVMKHNDKDSKDLSESLTDSKVATVVKTRLLFSADVSGTDINVDVAHGVVTLKGTVSSDAERDLALTIAKNTDDVKDVVDELRVTG